MDNQYYTPDQLAKMLQLTPQTLYGWRQRGLGPGFIKLSGTIRYSKTAVEKYLEKKKGQQP